MKSSFFWLICLFLFHSLAYSQPIIIFDKPEQVLNIGTSVSFLEDKESKLTLEQILTPTYQQQFRISEKEVPNFANTTSTIWGKLTVANKTSEKLLLEIGNPLLDSINFYDISTNKMMQVGALLEFKDRQINSTLFYFFLSSEIDSINTKTFYFKVKSNFPVEIPLKIGTPIAFLELNHKNDLGYAFYFGIMTIMALYNLFIFFSVRDKTYLYYVGYVASIALFYGHMKGYAFEFLWAGTPSINFYTPILSSIPVTLATVFTMSFLHTKQYTPKLNLGMFVTIILSVISIVLNLAGNYTISAPLSQFAAIYMSFFFLVISIVNHFKGNKLAKFYIFAWITYIICIVIFILTVNAVLPSTIFTRNSVLFGTAVEVVLLSFALAYKINVLKAEKAKSDKALLLSSQENERIIREQNIVLETKVTERTHQLQEANEELNQMVEELHATNEILNEINVQLAEQRKEIEAKNSDLGEAIQELNATNEELSSTNDALAMANETIEHKSKEVEKAYTNIKILSDIGQQITQTLDLKAVIKMVYNNVNQLMDASGFGLGVYNAKTKEIGFDGFMEKDKELPFHYHSTEDKNYLAVWCFHHQQPIFINDLEKELTQYIDTEIKVSAGEIPQSLLYIPLVLEGESIGIITVQSFEKYAYTETHFELLKNLAAYCSIAVANANAYKEIDSKNANITKSIEYARTIQQAVLPAPQQICSMFSNFMAIYKPKDIVSGDFYWFTTTDKYSFLAVADCTGHGVPGGFMSMIGNAILKDAIDKQNIYNPAEVLSYLHLEVRNALKKAENSTSDGMDITVCRFEKMSNNSLMMTFAGAKSMGLYFKQGNQGTEMVELKGDKQMIGAADTSERKPYTNQVFELQKGEKVYFFTDGYIDQPDDKRDRFGKARFKEMLQKFYHLPLAEQETTYEKALADYQGLQGQRDDITVIGLEI